MKGKAILIGLALATVAVVLLRQKPGPSPDSARPASAEVSTAVSNETTRAKPAPPTHAAVHRASATPPVPSRIDDPVALWAAIGPALASTNQELREFALTNLLPALVLADPAAAGQLAATNTLDDTRDIVLQKVARLLAARDSTNALAWAGSLQFSHEREAALTEVCLQMAQSDPAEAVAVRAKLLTENQSYDALEDLAQKWAEKDMSAVLTWIKKYPLDERRNLLLGRVLYLQSQTAPADAARMVVEDMSPGSAQTEAAISVLHQWGKQDLAAATAWAEAFPEGPLRDRALRELRTIGGVGESVSQ